MAEASARTVGYPASGGWETFTGDATDPVIRVRFPDGAEVAYRPSQRDSWDWKGPVAAVLAEAVTLAGVTVDVNAMVYSNSGELLSLYVIRTGVAGADGGLDIPDKVTAAAAKLACEHVAQARTALSGITRIPRQPRNHGREASRA